MPDPQLTEKELQALLRLKRYEQPAPAYFDGLLKDVRRQVQVDRVADGEEPNLSEPQLQALLRLKRYEQPPPAYFEGLLSTIHRRQRDELLRPPAWRRVLEKMVSAFTGPDRDWSYVGTMAGVLMIGLGVIQWVLPSKTHQHPSGSPMIANAVPVNAVKESIVVPSPENSESDYLQEKGYGAVKGARPNGPRNLIPPRFIIDTQPASYEAKPVQF